MGVILVPGPSLPYPLLFRSYDERVKGKIQLLKGPKGNPKPTEFYFLTFVLIYLFCISFRIYMYLPLINVAGLLACVRCTHRAGLGFFISFLVSYCLLFLLFSLFLPCACLVVSRFAFTMRLALHRQVFYCSHEVTSRGEVCDHRGCISLA